MRQPLPCNLIREKYGLEAGSYILYVGRISPEKGPLDLVEGYLKAHTDKKLVLAGPFAETEYCTTVREKIAGNPNIITTGYVVGDALLELYSNCALFVLPSHTEGLSLSLLEALSLGVKCLVSDIPENTTVTADYGTAFRTEDTDSLARALEREPFGAETVELCRITAERCRRTAQCAILLCVGGNLLQLLLLPQLRKVSFTMTLPLVSVALSAALFLLCRYFQQGKAIHDDNQSII